MDKSTDLIFDKSNQTKMLILFAMSRLTLPVTLDTLTQIIMHDERIGYFDITESVERLVKAKLLQLADGKYTITVKGRESSTILEKDLPRSVRLKVEEAAKCVNIEDKKDSLIVTRFEQGENGGYNVVMSLADGAGEILNIALYTASREQAEKLEKGFRKNAHTLYGSIVESILK